MDKQEILKKAKELTQDFLTQMRLDADVSVEETEGGSSKNPDATYINVKMEGEHLNELIGYHGKNLEATQVILGLMLSRTLEDRNIRLTIDINNYKDSREKYLKSYALRAAQEVRESGQEIELMAMKPSERRVVHLALETEEGIETESTGEGEERRVVIRKKS